MMVGESAGSRREPHDQCHGLDVRGGLLFPARAFGPGQVLAQSHADTMNPLCAPLLSSIALCRMTGQRPRPTVGA
jgi:hypothetical protein